MAVTLLDLGAIESGHIFGWDLASGETGAAVKCGQWTVFTVQIYGGNFNTGNLQIEGAVDPATPVYGVLRDSAGSAISGKTAAYIEAIAQSPCWIRPVATTITAVSVRLICKGRRVY